jgi:hypothetical protein
MEVERFRKKSSQLTCGVRFSYREREREREAGEERLQTGP